MTCMLMIIPNQTTLIIFTQMVVIMDNKASKIDNNKICILWKRRPHIHYRNVGPVNNCNKSIVSNHTIIVILQKFKNG